jgi:site-specific recombinase XerD
MQDFLKGWRTYLTSARGVSRHTLVAYETDLADFFA